MPGTSRAVQKAEARYNVTTECAFSYYFHHDLSSRAHTSFFCLSQRIIYVTSHYGQTLRCYRNRYLQTRITTSISLLRPATSGLSNTLSRTASPSTACSMAFFPCTPHALEAPQLSYDI